MTKYEIFDYDIWGNETSNIINNVFHIDSCIMWGVG